MRFGSTNPVFRKMSNSSAEFVDTANYEVATYKGVAMKSIFYLVVTLIGMAIGIAALFSTVEFLMTLLIISVISTIFTGIIALISPRASKVVGSLYCLAEGILIGIISFIFEAVAGGTVFAAFVSTIVVFAIISTLYMTNVVKVNGRFMRFMFAFAISVIISQVIIFIASLTGLFNYADNLWLVILISVVMVFLACLYLLFDLEKIRMLVEGNAPKRMEWYASFGLMFTLLWLYVEMLRIVFWITSRVRSN